MSIGKLTTRYKYWTAILAVLGFIIFLAPATASAQKMPPHLFLGEKGAVTKDSEPVKSGTITAWIDDKQIASAPIADGAYTLLVEQPEGSSFGSKKVIFTVDGDPTDANGIWRQGGADVLPLKVVSAPVATPTIAPVATESPAPTATSVPVAVSAAPAQQGNKGFRENPMVRLRPVNTEITTDQDGIIEAVMFNPSVNDVPLSVDIVLTVPSNVHVYGDGFACAGSGAGACTGSFTIIPAQSKTAVINFKGDKVGDYQVQFTGYWWPGENKDMRQPISLTHPFKVLSPSKDLLAPSGKTGIKVETKDGTKVEVTETESGAEKGGDGSCGMSSNGAVPLGAIVLFFGVGMLAFRNKAGKLF
jgi:hypothetical protein